MGSLQEQLLRAGMVDAKKHKQAKKEKRKQQRLQQKGQTASVDLTKQAVETTRKKQVERDRQLNQRRKEEGERKAIQAQIKQLIEMNIVATEEGDLSYSFNHSGKIKKLYVTDKIQGQLSRGLLSIVSLEGRYKLVPTAVAEKIRLRDEARVLVCNRAQKEAHEDDPYADYQVPDDLMW